MLPCCCDKLEPQPFGEQKTVSNVMNKKKKKKLSVKLKWRAWHFCLHVNTLTQTLHVVTFTSESVHASHQQVKHDPKP